MTRLDRSEAGREILSSTERLSDGLAEEENAAFARMAAQLREIAATGEQRLRGFAAARGRTQVWVDVDQVLPSNPDCRDALMPVVGDLLAVTRERTLVVVRRHMKACGQAVPGMWRATLPPAGVQAAKGQAPTLETEWYEKARADYARAYLDVRLRLRNQAEIWYGRDEKVDQLVVRWFAEEPEVRLPGAEARGALWGLRVWMNAAARNSSVALTNGLLIAAMTGWNEAVRATG